MRKTMMSKLAMLAAAGGVAFVFAASSARAQAPAPAAAAPANGVRKFTEVAVEIGKTKFWLPSTIVVEQGDKVELDLKNEVPAPPGNQHGFEIPRYNITEIVTAGKPPVKVEFTADKPGVFVFDCQLHPAHIGGQLIVRPKEGISKLGAS